MVVVRGKGSSGDGQKRKVAIVRAAISFSVLVCFKEVGNKLMAGLLRVRCLEGSAGSCVVSRKSKWLHLAGIAAECPLMSGRDAFFDSLFNFVFQC